VHSRASGRALLSIEIQRHKRLPFDNNVTTAPTTCSCRIVESGLDVHIVTRQTWGVRLRLPPRRTISRGYSPLRFPARWHPVREKISPPNDPGRRYSLTKTLANCCSSITTRTTHPVTISIRGSLGTNTDLTDRDPGGQPLRLRRRNYARCSTVFLMQRESAIRLTVHGTGGSDPRLHSHPRSVQVCGAGPSPKPAQIWRKRSDLQPRILTEKHKVKDLREKVGRRHLAPR